MPSSNNRISSVVNFVVASFICSLGLSAIQAHEWHDHSDWTAKKKKPSSTKPSSSKPLVLLTAYKSNLAKPSIAKHFEHFKNVKVRWDSKTLYVDSNGLPEHDMMVGIRNWQQQVPLPQPFTGNNSWKIPLQPKLAKTPINAKRTSFRGAIAVAVNGVPIFSALNNRGEDAFLAGELDKWGGHCGRGDDYHYHTAPLHLEDKVGKGNPIAFALDGFPIYGLNEDDGTNTGKLDELNGHLDDSGNYHYHSSKTYPYINGGIRGVVDFRNGEIASQPRDAPVRPGQSPLRGALITDFETNGKQSVLTYKLRGRTGKITYSQAGEDSYRFSFLEPNGNTRSETYQRRPRPGGPSDRNNQRPPPRGQRPPPRP